MKRILFLSRWFPFPPDNGSKLRIYNLLKQLSADFIVDLISFTSAPVTDQQIKELSRCCRVIKHTPYQPYLPWSFKALVGYFNVMPRNLCATYNPAFQRLMDDQEKNETYDLLLVSQIDMTPYIRRSRTRRRFVEEIEITRIYEEFQFQPPGIPRLMRGLTWWKLSQYLRHLSGEIRAFSVVSRREKDLLQTVCADTPVHLVPNGVDTRYNRPVEHPADPDSLVFSGSLTYNANYEAVVYFLREIFPLIKKRRPAARLTVTGRVEGVDLSRFTRVEGVTFSGFVEDVRPVIQRSRVNVVPILFGGGTRLKILESMALGVPVVSTVKGAEGLDLVPGRDLLVADNSQEFAEAVFRVLSDNELSASLAHNGRALVEQVYDWDKIGQRFREILIQQCEA